VKIMAIRTNVADEELTASKLVERLADPHRYFPAYQRLLEMGSAAAEAAEDGLGHPVPRVRQLCCQVLDHLAGAGSFVALLAAIDDPVADVRIQAIHALACDRCKADSCRPDATSVVPAAIRRLTSDPSPKVRAYAIELVGVWGHAREDCAAALATAAKSDPSPAVRKKASWYAPGGVIFRRTAPTRRERL